MKKLPLCCFHIKSKCVNALPNAQIWKDLKSLQGDEFSLAQTFYQPSERVLIEGNEIGVTLFLVVNSIASKNSLIKSSI